MTIKSAHVPGSPRDFPSDTPTPVPLLDLANASYPGFNSTAAFLWQQLQEPQTLAQLCDAAMTEFEVDEARCRAEIDSLLTHLLGANLVEVDRE